MANKKFSEFVLKTDTSDVSHIVGYNGAENVQITPANFVTGGGTGVFLPLAGGTMTGALVVDAQGTFNDILTAGLGLAITGGAVGSAKLVLASNNAVYLRGSSAGLILQNSAGTNSLTVDTNSVFSGSLGLAGVTPSEKLDTPNMVISGSTITGTTRANALYVDNLGGNSRFFSCGADASSNGSYSFRTGTSATLGATLLTLTSTESTFSTQANLIGGTAASPSLIFGGDGDTGLFHPSANTIAFSTFGAERMRLDASGNLGIGTSSPSEKLTVESGAGFIATFKSLTASDFRPIRFQNAAGNDVGYLGNDDSTDDFFLRANDQPLVFGSGSSGAERMRIDASGNVGVGTATPRVQTEIYGTGQLTSAISDSGNTGATLSLSSNSGSAGSGGCLLFAALNDSGNTKPQASIKSLLTNGNSQGVGDLAFSTRASTSDAVLTERMRLDSAGNLGIGILPVSGARLSLGTGVVANEILSFAAASGGNAEIRNTSSTGSFTFTNNNGASEKMRITSTGDLLVGTTTSFALATHDPNVITNQSFGVSDGTNNSTIGLDRIHFDSSNYFVLNGSAIGVKLVNGATAWAAQSDESLKENIKPLENVLDKIKDYRCVEYNLKAEKTDKKIGFIAQDWEQDFDAIVDKDADGILSMKYTETIPVLLKAIQELSAKLEALECQCEKK